MEREARMMEHPPAPARQPSNYAFWSVMLGAFGLVIQPLTLVGLPLGLMAWANHRRVPVANPGLIWVGLGLNGVVWAFWLVVIIAAIAGAGN